MCKLECFEVSLALKTVVHIIAYDLYRRSTETRAAYTSRMGSGAGTSRYVTRPIYSMLGYGLRGTCTSIQLRRCIFNNKGGAAICTTTTLANTYSRSLAPPINTLTQCRHYRDNSAHK
eukprot:4122506-Pyramimonas_sp.AAC.2